MIIFFEFPIMFIVIVILAILGADIIPMITFICTITGILALIWGGVKRFLLEESASGWLIFSGINLFVAFLLDMSGVKINLWNVFSGLF